MNQSVQRQPKKSVLDSPVWYKRWWNNLSNSFKGNDKNTNFVRWLCVALATLMFILLVGSAEYKVFEALYTATGKDIFLTASALLVTGVSAVISEILHGNPANTPDQSFETGTLFFANLFVAAILGLAAYANAAQTNISLIGYSVNFGGLINIAYILIVIMTAIEILVYRDYFNRDVERTYSNRMAKISARQRESELDTQESVAMVQEKAQRKARKILAVEVARAEVRKTLIEEYDGSVPNDVMNRAMAEIDNLELSDEDTDGRLDTVRNTGKQSFGNRPNPQNRVVSTRPISRQEMGQGMRQNGGNAKTTVGNDSDYESQEEKGGVSNHPSTELMKLPTQQPQPKKSSVFSEPQVRPFPSEQGSKESDKNPIELPPQI